MKIPNSPATVWLFDYDLTLYGERKILDSLDARISLFVERTVGCSPDEASRIRKDYLLRFGTTLAGLRKIYGVSPNDYFDFIHEPEYLTYPEFSREKLHLLEEIAGPKYVFTNGRSDWSRAGISRMGLSGCFRKIVGLENLGWEGKPSKSAYEKMESALTDSARSADGELCKIVLLDDSLKNLKPAHDRGWTTVWVNADGDDAPPFIDAKIPDLMRLRDLLSPDSFR